MASVNSIYTWKADCQSKSEVSGLYAAISDVSLSPFAAITANIVSYCCENLKQPQKQPKFYFHTGYGKEKVLYTMSDNVCYLPTALNYRKYAIFQFLKANTITLEMNILIELESTYYPVIVIL